MLAAIALTVLVLVGLALAVFTRQYESNVVIFLVILACTVYVVAGAVNAIMLQVRIVPYAIFALLCLAALGTMMYRRRKQVKG